MGFGDELIVSGQARVLQQTDPRKVRVVFERPKWNLVWNGNPRIARPSETGDFQTLVARANHLRPYMASKTSQRWTWKEFRPPPGEIYFTEQEQTFGRSHSGRVILEPTIKQGASPNKNWGWVRWNKLAWILGKRGVRVTQLGPLGTPLLEGAEHVVTNDFRSAAAVLANARAAVLHEGGLHHAAAAFGIPAVVIFGGFISPAVTGYESQESIFTGEGLGCGMRVRCDCCKTAMSKIAPESVAEQFIRMVDETSARLVSA